MLLEFNSSRDSHSVSYHGKRSVRNAKNFQVRTGVVDARCRLQFTLELQPFFTLASPSTPVYGMKSWIDPTLPVASRSVR